MKFTVERDRWFRGQGPQGSRLLRSSDGKMCCLGFFCISAGLRSDQIEDVTIPAQMSPRVPFDLLPAVVSPLVETYGICSSAIAVELIHANDSGSISEDARESELRRLFAKLGHEVEFV